jgi:hypothetical protein
MRLVVWLCQGMLPGCARVPVRDVSACVSRMCPGCVRDAAVGGIVSRDVSRMVLG